MIVISRELGQALIIGVDIIVQIVEADGDRVHLGVSTPSNISVCKEEHLVVPDAVVHAEKPREENP